MPGACLPPVHPSFPRLTPDLFFLEVIEVSSEDDVFGWEVCFTDFLP
jgi:hypothetical protein